MATTSKATPIAPIPHSTGGANAPAQTATIGLAKRVQWQRALLVAGDAAVITGLTYAAKVDRSGAAFVASTLLMTLLWMAILYFRGHYGVVLTYKAHQRVYELVKVITIGVVSMSVLLYFVHGFALSQNELLLLSMLTGCSLIVWREIYCRAFPLIQNRRTIIVGAGGSGTAIAKEIARNPKCGYELIGFVDDSASKQSSTLDGHPVLSAASELPQLAAAHQANAIVIAITHKIHEPTLKAIGDCLELGCEVQYVSQLHEQLSGRVPIEYIGHSWFIHAFGESNRTVYEVTKRLVDITFATLGLLITAGLFPLVALIIRLDSKGPIFYSQVRVGKNGRLFKIYKFRTMIQDAEKNGAVWAAKNDARITRIGDFLRKTRLDELPQLFNILRGEMSLVGPRPERPEFVETLAASIPFFNRRHIVLPGLTGWAQVNYPYGASVDDAREKLQYDLYYLKNRSIFLDLEIMLRTISVVLRKTGAR